MSAKRLEGWEALLDEHPWFAAEGKFPLPAYSEFMPPPRLGLPPYDGDVDRAVLPERDPFGWSISEMEEEYELGPGLESLAQQIVGALVRLGQGEPEHHIPGHEGENLVDNPYWPRDLAEHAGHLVNERYVVLLPLALSRTQDDMGRVRWTLFGASEQGPERAFWKGFYRTPDEELPKDDAPAFLYRLLASAYGRRVDTLGELHEAGFRILPSLPDPQFAFWDPGPLPSWTKSFLAPDDAHWEHVRYLLTFRPFDRLPPAVKERYFAGDLALWPFPGSLVSWGMPTYRHLQVQLPLAMQIAILRWVTRRGGPSGVRVPQSGWMDEPRPGREPHAVKQELLRHSYQRTSRWHRAHRYDDELAVNPRVDRVARVLFSTAGDALGLYDKPMARNAQIWTRGFDLVLDGPRAAHADLERAAATLAAGGLFAYRFLFPAMRVGRHEVYWHRPLAAYVSPKTRAIELLPGAPLGYLTAYPADAVDLAHPVELWPRVQRRELYLSALCDFDPAHDYYAHQTGLNVLTLLEVWRLTGERPLPRSFARHMVRTAREHSLEEWLDLLPARAQNPERGRRMRRELAAVLEPEGAPAVLPPAVTFAETATRAFEEAWWGDIVTLAHGRYVNKDNADCVQDPATQSKLTRHQRDLEELGDYLLDRYRRAIEKAGMEGRAVCGEIPFKWRTDFDFALFGGWRLSQEGHGGERDLLVVIPGKNRGEAVILGDHYDTAYMEDVFEPERGGSGARLAAAGADDNHSATATLLQAAPIFLRLAKEGRLERDVWLLHLTGEEFPADCLGARHVCQALVENTLHLRRGGAEGVDLSQVRVVGVYIMDMIGHNRDDDKDLFQISPGRGAAALRLAWHAHQANLLWNAGAAEWNQRPDRRGTGRGRRIKDPAKIPDIALHPHLHGEVRTVYDPESSLYNTDGQIFSDVGVPVVLFMENYDIDRSGYHDTKDTMENIDLDYGAAFGAIAIETVARVALQPEV